MYSVTIDRLLSGADSVDTHQTGRRSRRRLLSPLPRAAQSRGEVRQVLQVRVQALNDDRLTAGRILGEHRVRYRSPLIRVKGMKHAIAGQWVWA